MAILKKVSGVYQDIGGLSKKVSGVVSDADSAWVKENGVWVEKWANWSPTIFSNYEKRTTFADTWRYYFSSYTEGTETPTTIRIFTNQEAQVAISKGYTKVHVKIIARANAISQTDGSSYSYASFYRHSNVGGTNTGTDVTFNNGAILEETLNLSGTNHELGYYLVSAGGSRMYLTYTSGHRNDAYFGFTISAEFTK